MHRSSSHIDEFHVYFSFNRQRTMPSIHHILRMFACHIRQPSDGRFMIARSMFADECYVTSLSLLYSLSAALANAYERRTHPQKILVPQNPPSKRILTIHPWLSTLGNQTTYVGTLCRIFTFFSPFGYAVVVPILDDVYTIGLGLSHRDAHLRKHSKRHNPLI